MELSGLTVTQLELKSVNTKFDLTLILEKTAGGLVGKLEYNIDLFKASSVERLIGHFKKLLDSVVKNPFKPIYELPLLTEAEQQQLMAWNDTTTDYPADKTIHQLFDEQVERTPDNIAVVFENKQLSYRELNEKANQLAHYLLSLKSQGGTVLLRNNPLIAIAVERSLFMVIGLLGILKAGSAYVPIEPNSPPVRIRYMLSDSAAPLLLTQSHLKTHLSLDVLEHDYVMLCLDEAEFADMPTDNPLVNYQASTLAYVIYTSGSTGKPKGVMVEHCNVVNLLYGFEKQAAHLTPLTGIFTVPFSFDLSVWEIFSQLCYGGTLHVLSQKTLLETDLLISYLLDKQVSSAYIPPALLELIANQLKKRGNPLQRLLVGVEPISQKVLQEFRALSDELYIINGYGPTEATVCATFYQFTHAIESERRTPIGKPAANYQIYILNANNQPQPIGLPGELCIAGRGVARGYLKRTELTAEKFIEVELFGKTERIYKTGDLAQWLPDGNLEYLGRIDHQVKLRGFRIELGEIESVLATHPFVTENVVIVHETESGDKRLVAFIVPNQGQVIDTQALHTFLIERLPNYMIPSAFISKESLPLTPNGKIDRKTLSQLSVDSYQLLGKTFIAPRDTLELQLVQIWEDVLNVRPIGVRDNFFELGGHSLLAVRLMAQIGQQLNKHLPLATLFQGSTIEQLATLLHQQTDTLPWSPLVAIQPKGEKPPLFCVHPGGGNVLCYFELAQHLGTEQPFYGLQAVGIEAGQKPKTTVEEMATFYIKALQTVQPQGPYQLVGWSFGGIVAFEMARQLQAQAQSVSFLALLDTVTPCFFSADSQQSKENEAQLLVELFAETNIALSPEHLRQLNPDEQLAYVIKQGQQANLFSSEIKAPNIKRLLDVYQANRQAFQRYQPQLYRGKITIFPAIERQEELFPGTSKGWKKFTQEGVDIHPVPGNHSSMVRSPQVQVLAEQLKLCLEQTHE